jgi:ATP-binding cassette subfamily B protein
MNFEWEKEPFCLLTPEQQIKLRNQAQTYSYQTGKIIWSTDEPGNQFLIISGNVRLREDGKSQSLATLKAGDWFGDLLGLSGDLKAVTSKNVEVVRWDAALWKQASPREINRFWQQERSRYQPMLESMPGIIRGTSPTELYV